MKRAGKAKLPPHVLAAVEEKARLRRIDERAHFWSEVESARTGVGGARSHGRCLPDAEEDLFPGSFEDVEDADASEASAASSRAGARRAEIEAAYDDIPVKTVDPLGEPMDPLGGAEIRDERDAVDYDPVSTGPRFPTPPPFPVGPRGVDALAARLAAVADGGADREPSAAEEALKRTISRRLGFATLTPIQRHAVPLALAGRDLVCSAATGSGKTFAYLAPAIATAIANETTLNDSTKRFHETRKAETSAERGDGAIGEEEENTYEKKKRVGVARRVRPPSPRFFRRRA